MRRWPIRSVVCALMLLGAIPAAGAGLGRPAGRIQVSVPRRVRQHTVYDVTIRGFSRHRAMAYLFVDYASCARSFAVEHRRAPKESDAYVVKGSFTKISGWKSSSPGVDHACAYLVASSSGRTLTSTRLSYEVH